MLDDNPEGERGRIGPLGEENIEEAPAGIPQLAPLRREHGRDVAVPAQPGGEQEQRATDWESTPDAETEPETESEPESETSP